MPDRPGDVGQPAHVLLRGVVRRVEHLRVEAHAGHHRETPLADAADVDAPPAALQCHLDAGGQIAAEPQVRGEQVAGAGRQHGERHLGPGERADTGHHGAVATADEDDLGAVPHRLGGLTGPGILRGGLQPHRLGPAGRGEGLGDDPAQLVQVGHLHRVDDDG